MTIREKIEKDISAESAAVCRARYFRPLEESCRFGEPPPSSAGDDLAYRAAFVASTFYTAGDGPNDSPDPITGSEVETCELYRETAAKASLYLGLCKAETGLSLPDDVLEKRRRELRDLKTQTFELADRLEASGYAAYRQTPFSLWHFYVHSRHLERIPNFRRVHVLPYVSAMIRAPMLSSVESFLERNPFCRFWTFTTGARCAVLDVRERLRYLHRKISTLNGQPFMKSAGLEIVFRSSELGSPETRPDGSICGAGGSLERENGQVFFHPHAHCIVLPKKGYISPRRWDGIIKNVWRFWVHHWDAGASVANARECVKYVTKPGDMLKLSGEELAALAAQLRRMKLVQPSGILADEIAGRKLRGERLIRIKTPDGRVFKSVPDWNRQRKQTEEEKHAAAARKLSAEKPDPQTRIVARLLPAIGPAGVKEPRVIVMTSGALDVALLCRHAAVGPLIEATRAEFLAGVRIRVHTCTSTVLPGLEVDAISSWKPPDGAELAGFAR
jgi:hypothetical protein